MKIKYEFINGESTEIEVDETIGTFILDSRRIEENLARKERYHCLSSDAFDSDASDTVTEGSWGVDERTPEYEFFKKLKNKRIETAFSALSETQRRRPLLYIDGVSVNEIARIEGINPNAAWKSIEGARKKFIKNF